MAYSPQVWTNAPSTASPVSAARLNINEQGTAEASDRLDAIEANPIVTDLDTTGAAVGGLVAATAVDGSDNASAFGSDWALSSRLQDLEFSGDHGSRQAAFTPSGWESTSVQEPSVWYRSGAFHMIYTGGASGNHRLGYATATDPLGTWTHSATPVLGAGNGGHAGGAYHANVFVDGTTLYCYFVDDTDNTLLRVATASIDAPSTWTLTGTTYALPAGSTLWGNCQVFRDGATTYMLLETSTAASSWQLSLGTLAGGSPTGALTVTQTSLPTLRPSAGNATATTSNALIFQVGSTWVLYYHAGTAGSLPTAVYRATSTDLVTWTIDNGGLPIIRRAHPYEVDQVADVALAADAAGAYFGFWTAMDNTAGVCRVMVSPARPGLLRRTSTGWVKAGPTGGAAAPALTSPQKTHVVAVTGNSTVTGATFADITGLTGLRFIPRGTRALVRLSGAGSNTNSLASNKFQVTDGGSLTKSLGAVTAPSGGVQFGISGTALLTGLTPGQRYNLRAQVRVSAGTFQVRTISNPEEECLGLTVEDVEWPLSTG